MIHYKFCKKFKVWRAIYRDDKIWLICWSRSWTKYFPENLPYSIMFSEILG